MFYNLNIYLDFADPYVRAASWSSSR